MNQKYKLYGLGPEEWAIVIGRKAAPSSASDALFLLSDFLVTHGKYPHQIYGPLKKKIDRDKNTKAANDLFFVVQMQCVIDKACRK